MKSTVKHLDIYRNGLTNARAFRIEAELHSNGNSRGLLIFISGVVQENGSICISQEHNVSKRLAEHGYDAQSVIADLERHVRERIAMLDPCPRHI